MVTGQSRKNTCLQTAWLSVRHLWITLPLPKAQVSPRKRVQSKRQRLGEHSKEAVSSGHDRDTLHLRTQSGCGCLYLHKNKPVNSPAWREKGLPASLSLPQPLMASGEGSQVFGKGAAPGKLTTCWEKSHSHLRMGSTNQTLGSKGRSLVCEVWKARGAMSRWTDGGHIKMNLV